MRNGIFLTMFLFCFVTEASSQFTKRVVFFTDKNGTPYSLNNPTAFITQRAADRRARYNLAIDSTDLPVISRYIDSIRLAGAVTILGRSKWLNAVMIQTNDANAIAKINSFPFVKKTDSIALKANNSLPFVDKFAPLPSTPTTTTNRTEQTTADTFNYGTSANQVKIHKGEFLHNIGARGQTMMIAVLDAGFTGFLTNPFFDSARARNQFLGAWDFVQNNSNVNEDHPHGLQCFSTIAAYKPGTFVGTAPESKYFLLRTEDAPTEQMIEEYNWCLGAEYADSAGVDVISSSLGYTTFDNASFNHTYADMNGNTTVITRMADMAAKKGILVVNSAGNDGQTAWHFIGAPADGDSVLSVGAVNGSGVIAGFSSFGPTSDGQVKPDAVSVGSGTVVSSTSGTTQTGSGTSYSAPNLAGLATCLWQLFPEYNNYKIITTIQKSGDRYTAPHIQYGYGLPNMKKAVGFLLADISAMNISLNNLAATINWNSKDIAGMRYDIERKLPGETVYSTITSVASTVRPFANRSYQFIDNIPTGQSGLISYRIKQVIDTAVASFDAYAIDSATVTLFPTGINNPGNPSGLVQLFPNPAQSTITLQFFEVNRVSNISIQIYNAQSQLVLKQNFDKAPGTVTHQLSVASLPKGNYFVVLMQNGKQYELKEFIKQ
jgi:serine protease AprX